MRLDHPEVAVTFGGHFNCSVHGMNLQLLMYIGSGDAGDGGLEEKQTSVLRYTNRAGKNRRAEDCRVELDIQRPEGN